MVKLAAQPKIKQEEAVGSLAKEREFVENRDAVQLEELRKEIELSPEVKESGVELKSEEIELSQEIQKIGMEVVGSDQSLVQPTTNVPLQDNAIVGNQNSSVWLSLTWLAQWCLRQLKKAHVKLKKVHGKVVRIVTK